MDPTTDTSILDVISPAIHGWGLFYLITGLWLLLAGIAACLMGRAIHTADQREHTTDDDGEWLAVWPPSVDRPVSPLTAGELDEFDAITRQARP